MFISHAVSLGSFMIFQVCVCVCGGGGGLYQAT